MQTMYFNIDWVNRMTDMYAELCIQTGDINLQVSVESYMYIWLYRMYGNDPQKILKEFAYMAEYEDTLIAYLNHFDTLTPESIAEVAIDVLEGI